MLEPAEQPGGDGVGVGDGAWGEPGAGGVYGDGAGGAYGVRGDGVGVGDVGAVHGWIWNSGDTAGGDDGGGAVGEWHGDRFVRYSQR